jgi:hypothetical protein
LRIASAWLLVLLLVGGCATVGDDRAGLAAECPGRFAPIAGLAEIRDDSLAARALGRAGTGGLCGARVYVVTTAVTVYRAWDSAVASSEFGAWWALDAPQGTRDDYRKAYAVCPAWSRLDRVVACSLKPGSRVVVGPGQSVDCGAGGFLAASATAQAYLHQSAVQFEACGPAQW